MIVVQFQDLPDDSPPAAATSPLAAMRELYRRAAQRISGVDSYQMRIRRREVINAKQMPEEIMVARFRKEPFSVYFKWVGNEAKGRELVYVMNQHENKVHTLLAAGDHPFYPAGKHYKIAPDSVLLTSRSRYPIANAGLGPLIDRFGKLVQAQEKGDGSLGKAEYLGPVKRPEFAKEMAGVRQKLPAGADSTLPRGGERLWHFDSASHMPALIVAFDETGREVEYYCHDLFWFDAPGAPLWNDNDFDPDRLWPGAK